jgi:hypothetical protein
VFGISPAYEELNWTGLNFSTEQFKTVTSIDKAAWQKELQLHADLFQQLAYHLPAELQETKARIETAPGGLKRAYGHDEKATACGGFFVALGRGLSRPRS